MLTICGGSSVVFFSLKKEFVEKIDNRVANDVLNRVLKMFNRNMITTSRN